MEKQNISDKNDEDVPTPSKSEVLKYLLVWDSLENYTLQENALEKLFFRTYPKKI
ncbi:hypothetical protein JYU21_02235 [Alkaliphilus sp. AH-315-G20]|nr:hypothetical protein [Alkaliphilus sp. AH-315-G20]